MVGLGPGGTHHLTPAARAALAQAEVIAGYKGYMDLVEPELLEGKELISTGMTGEVDRAGRALDAALDGKRVAVVSSGDPGVYAMAGLVLEMAEARGLLDEIGIEVVPGVPAFCAAAALLGAPLMHDFASVSLSDLLTPWPLIEKRLDAAASADFVIALYNPRSKRRTGHLERALEIVSRHRDPATPVGVVGRAMRAGQSVTRTTLDGVDPEIVDMQTVIIIGNSSTRAAGGFMLTPRGYEGKYELG
ncbi:precorrin-3B C(17)-methyltransferase [Paucidesulfovibrio longus]|uniref:precorrin-3B C(17)-methyltransferase n=1 Tax=Paucidesulfovibrio longus TaxID=889 RepID=UPI0003B7406E|nr:precorrin-3B C(17)-methyltransferase [Paucidesulfovibrio longus]